MNAIEALLARAALQHSAFARAQALRLGVTASMLRARSRRTAWPEVAPGVHVIAGSPATWRQALSVATLAPGGPVYATNGSAARLHGFDVFGDHNGLEVIGARGRRPRTAPGVHVHWSRRLVAGSVTVVDGIASLNVATTLVMLARTSPVELVEQALDDAVRQGTSLRWLRRTVGHHDHPGSRATARLRELLLEYEGGRPLPESWFERLTERLLATVPDLPELERQIPVRRSDGSIARIDLGVPSLRVGIECQSKKHHGSPARAHRDAVRSRSIDVGADWDLLPVWWRDLDRVDEVRCAFMAKVDRRRRELAGLAALRAMEILGQPIAPSSAAGGVAPAGRLTTPAV
jgi:hypothetical protein